MSKRLAIAIIATLLSSLAVAPDTVFDVALAEPFSIPECKRSSIGYEYAGKSVCFKRLFDRTKSTAPVTDETVSIVFPLSETPPLLSGNTMTGLIMEGRLEGVGFNTRGIRNQDEVLAALKAKYGEPSGFDPHKVQNRMGASFDTFNALWTTPTLDVMYQSVTTTVDSGLVTVDTKKGAAWRVEQLKAIRSRGPSL